MRIQTAIISTKELQQALGDFCADNGGGIGVYYFCKTDKCSYFHKTQDGAAK